MSKLFSNSNLPFQPKHYDEHSIKLKRNISLQILNLITILLTFVKCKTILLWKWGNKPKELFHGSIS